MTHRSLQGDARIVPFPMHVILQGFFVTVTMPYIYLLEIMIAIIPAHSLETVVTYHFWWISIAAPLSRTELGMFHVMLMTFNLKYDFKLSPLSGYHLLG